MIFLGEINFFLGSIVNIAGLRNIKRIYRFLGPAKVAGWILLLLIFFGIFGFVQSMVRAEGFVKLVLPLDITLEIKKDKPANVGLVSPQPFQGENLISSQNIDTKIQPAQVGVSGTPTFTVGNQILSGNTYPRLKDAFFALVSPENVKKSLNSDYYAQYRLTQKANQLLFLTGLFCLISGFTLLASGKLPRLKFSQPVSIFKQGLLRGYTAH